MDSGTSKLFKHMKMQQEKLEEWILKENWGKLVSCYNMKVFIELSLYMELACLPFTGVILG